MTLSAAIRIERRLSRLRSRGAKVWRRLERHRAEYALRIEVLETVR